MTKIILIMNNNNTHELEIDGTVGQLADFLTENNNHNKFIKLNNSLAVNIKNISEIKEKTND